MAVIDQRQAGGRAGGRAGGQAGGQAGGRAGGQPGGQAQRKDIIRVSKQDKIIYYYWGEKRLFFQIDINEKEQMSDFFYFLESNKDHIPVGNDHDAYHLYRNGFNFGCRLIN